MCVVKEKYEIKGAGGSYTLAGVYRSLRGGGRSGGGT